MKAVHIPFILAIFSLSCWLVTGCGQDSVTTIDQGIVVAEKAKVFNSTALVAIPLKELKRGDQVDIIERRAVNQQEFTRVRVNVEGDKPLDGWMETRFVVSKRIVDQSDKMREEWKDISTQATGKTKDRLNLRLKPSRDSDVATLLPAGTKVDIVGRARTERAVSEDGTKKYDNWYKVRLEGDMVIKAGWLYADSVEFSTPPAVSALLGAGRRFSAWRAFGKVSDPQTNNEESHYIILDKYAYSKDEDIDFDRIYVVVWDIQTHAYQSIYIESQIRGVYPFQGEAQGDDYVFRVNLLNKEEQPVPANYIVKRDPKTNALRVSRVVEKVTKPAKTPAKSKPKT